MIVDMLLMEDDIYGVCGNIMIIDMQGLYFGHIVQFSLPLIKYANKRELSKHLY